MTEEEWSARPAPWIMVSQLLTRWSTARTKIGRRKLRLFGCACCRRVWHLLTHPTGREAVETAERFADGQATQSDLDNAARRIEVSLNAHRRSPWDSHQPQDDRTNQAHCAVWIAAGKVCGKAALASFAYSEVGIAFRWLGGEAAEMEAQAELLRDIFGNPFRPVTFNRAWRTTDVMLLAQGIYDEKAFDRMPILADALQDAGCDSTDILHHLRDPHATHVRGCWAIDLVLGKS